ncbi:MAG: hypothetical protein ACPG49_12980 [Chitinophagales bacterium]
MKKLNPFILLIVTFLLFSTSCKTVKNVLPDDYSTNGIELPFEILSVDIVDVRNQPLMPMMWGMKKQEWMGNPLVSSTNKSEIESIIRKTSKTGGIEANFEFRVMKGEVKVSKSVLESVTFKGELEVTIPTETLPFKSHAEIRYDNPTKKTTEEFTLDLYNLAVRNVTDAILKEMKKGLNDKKWD